MARGASGAVQDSQKRLDMVQAKARATAKAVVRSETARALRDALDDSYDVSEGASTEEELFQAAKGREERMRKILSSLATLASASGVSQERALFMEVAKSEVQNIISKMNTRGGAGPLLMYCTRGGARPRHLSRRAAVRQRASAVAARLPSSLPP